MYALEFFYSMITEEKMKKSISLLVVLALILSLFALVGCGGEEAEDDALTVTVVVSAGFGDKSFNDSAKDGADRLAADRRRHLLF